MDCEILEVQFFPIAPSENMHQTGTALAVNAPIRKYILLESAALKRQFRH